METVHGMEIKQRVTRLTGLGFRKVGLRRARGDDGSALTAALATMRRKRYCLLVTESEVGPSARVVQPHRPDEQLAVHLGTSAGSRKADEIARQATALLVYQDDSRAACVVARCTAQLLDDEASRRRWFMPGWSAFWPDGPGPDFIVIRCEPQELEVWDAWRGITPPPFGLASHHLHRTDAGWTGAAPRR